MNRACEEIHVFDHVAERTGNVVELRGLRARSNACTSMRDLVRKSKLYGDGMYYLPMGLWPEASASVSLDNVKWIGIDATMR